MKIWLQEFAVTHHRPYRVMKSNANTRYVVKCEVVDCPWIVRARKIPGNGSAWKISSHVGPHMCGSSVLSGKHRQLTSAFLGHRLVNAIKAQPTQSAAALREFIFLIFHYRVKYGKAWRAKQTTMKMAYGDWEEAYEPLPRMFEAMKYRNPGMITFYEPHDSKIRVVNGVSTPVFGRAF